MQLSKCVAVGAFVLAGLLSQLSTAKATPVSSAANSSGLAINSSTSGLLHKASGCHRSRQYHMVFLWGYPAWHRHRAGCAPIAAYPPGRAVVWCHRGWRNHVHPAWGGGGWHRHVGPKCVVQWR